MLVLSRRRHEAIVLTTPEGRRIDVIVVELRGDKVRLGIMAQDDVQIDRLEVYYDKLTQQFKEQHNATQGQATHGSQEAV